MHWSLEPPIQCYPSIRWYHLQIIQYYETCNVHQHERLRPMYEIKLLDLLNIGASSHSDRTVNPCSFNSTGLILVNQAAIILRPKRVTRVISRTQSELALSIHFLTIYILIPDIYFKAMIHPAAYSYVTYLRIIREESDIETTHCRYHKRWQPHDVSVAVYWYVEILHVVGIYSWLKPTK